MLSSLTSITRLRTRKIREKLICCSVKIPMPVSKITATVSFQRQLSASRIRLTIRSKAHSREASRLQRQFYRRVRRNLQMYLRADLKRDHLRKPWKQDSSSPKMLLPKQMLFLPHLRKLRKDLLTPDPLRLQLRPQQPPRQQRKLKRKRKMLPSPSFRLQI